MTYVLHLNKTNTVLLVPKGTGGGGERMQFYQSLLQLIFKGWEGMGKSDNGLNFKYAASKMLIFPSREESGRNTHVCF